MTGVGTQRRTARAGVPRAESRQLRALEAVAGVHARVLLLGMEDVEIGDDSIGGADPNAGSGLEGLRDRMSAIDGWLAIDSPLRKGTVVRVSLPVTEFGAISP